MYNVERKSGKTKVDHVIEYLYINNSAAERNTLNRTTYYTYFSLLLTPKLAIPCVLSLHNLS